MASATYEPQQGSTPAATPREMFEQAAAGLSGAHGFGGLAAKGSTGVADKMGEQEAENGRVSPVAAPEHPAPIPMPQVISNRVADRLVNSGVSLSDFKAMSKDDQQTLLQQLAAEEQQAMIEGFEAARFGFDMSKR